MPMPPSPYTSIEVLLAIFESYMHNCTTTSIEALLPMSKYYIYKQAIHLFLLQNVELPASRWFGLSTGRRSGDGSKLWTSVFRSVCGNHGWDCEIVQWWESWVRFFYLGKMGEIVTISAFSLRRHQDCWHLSHLSKPFQPCFKSGNLVMGTSISWTSPALPLLQKPEEVKLWTGLAKNINNFFIGV